MTATTTPFPSAALRTELPPQNIASPTYTLASVTATSFGRHVVSSAGRLENILWDLADNGTGSTTAFKFTLNGVDISAASATAAGSSHGHSHGIINVGIDVAAGDVLACTVTAAATGTPVNLSYAPNVAQLFD